MNQQFTQQLDLLSDIYRGRKHPLDYKNRYQLIVMVILSAQDSDKHINGIMPDFFNVYPDMQTLATAREEDLHQYLSSVRNFGNKCNWLIKLAQTVGDDDKIPVTMAELTKLPGVGRKSANVIIRESDGQAEGVIVDLHVVRVAPRIGIARGTQPERIEKQLMAAVPSSKWNDLGMSISFLGREICRPTNPKCDQCVMAPVCEYHNPNLKQEEKDLFSDLS
jgi:endonuclease-3